MGKYHQQDLSLSEILQIRRDKLAELKATGNDPYEIVRFDRDAQAADILNGFEQYEGKSVTLAGRIMSKRVMGKASFFHFMDMSAQIQAYIKVDDVGADAYQTFKKTDIGDIIGLTGVVFKTQKGEISIHTHSIQLLSKSLLPLPEKFHGLKDQDLRYRQRYVDLIVNPDVRETFIKRSKIIKGIRDFLDDNGFLEVETPQLHSIAGGASARPFITHHNALNIDLYLRIALELYLKRLIVGGFEKVYEIGRVFRNEGMDPKHNPEFTLLELYQAYTDYYGMMDLTENLLRKLAKDVCGSEIISYGEYTLDFSRPFERISMKDAVKKYAGVDFDEIETLEQARAVAKEHHIEYEDRHKKGDILNLFFEEYAEEKLIQPTFVMDHPIEISPLAKKHKDHPEYTQRFELFIVGREHANAFSELNDPLDQKQRFLEQVKLREAGDDEANMMDDDFINALEYGMPPTGGIGIGIDRLVMLLTNTQSIRDVLLFPTMKPLDK